MKEVGLGEGAGPLPAGTEPELREIEGACSGSEGVGLGLGEGLRGFGSSYLTLSLLSSPRSHKKQTPSKWTRKVSAALCPAPAPAL